MGVSAFFLQGVGFLSLPLVALAAFYLYASAVGPLLRASLQVALEPEGMRMGGLWAVGPCGTASYISLRRRGSRLETLSLGIRLGVGGGGRCGS